MIAEKTNGSNYTFYDYKFNKTILRYVVMNDSKSVFMMLIPIGTEGRVNCSFKTVIQNDNGYPCHFDWYPGTLVHLHLGHHMTPMYENSLRFSESTKKLKFDRQETFEEDNKKTIKTYMKADEGYSVCHVLTNYDGEDGFEVYSEFTNNTRKNVWLEMLTSVSLDNLSPYMADDGSKSIAFHYFKGGWSTEGKHIRRTLPELNMEKSWGGSFECEKIGVIGSKSVGRYFPYAAVEDFENGCIWGVKLKHNASWQIELSRYGTPLSLSAGMADYRFGAWRKMIADNESFRSPTAYIVGLKGGIADASNALIKMNDRDIDAYGEEGMPITFNDWVTHWGEMSSEKLLSIANCLKDSKTKYFVADDGWQKNGIGIWDVDRKKFPDGFGAYSKKIRELGMVPGIWMEFEAIRQVSNENLKTLSGMCLERDGIVIANAQGNNNLSRFFDFRKKETIEYLTKKVVNFLKANDIGYIKVDYNINAGIGCDGDDSLGEGLRKHMEEVHRFFKKMKEEIPDLIIENCASGGSRLDPLMTKVSAMSSFSDAHECFELPVIAANMHYLISPRQSQIWCVLKDSHDIDHMKYTIASGFLGRICWSGYIDKLSDWQFDMLLSAESFYEKVSGIIKSGKSEIFRTNEVNNRYLIGTQAVIRYSDDYKSALIVCHFFNKPNELKIKLCGDYRMEDSLYEHRCIIQDGYLKVRGSEKSGNVIYIVKE